MVINFKFRSIILFAVIFIVFTTSLVAAEKTNKKNILNKLLNQKDEKPLTLEDLSIRYGVSRERIRQIESKAFEKLQIEMKVRAKEINLIK